MTKEAKLKVHISNKTLWITLGVLLLAMTCLIIGIVAVGIRNGKGLPAIGDNGSKEDFSNIDSGVEEEYKVDRSAYSGDHADEVATAAEINNAIAPLSADEAQTYLNEQLERYRGTEMESRIKIMKVWVYVNDSNPEKAIEVSEDVNEESLNDLQKTDYYSALRTAYKLLGDYEQEEEYKAKWQEIYSATHPGRMGLGSEDISSEETDQNNEESTNE